MCSTKKEKIAVAIAGLGFGESVHIPAIKSNPRFDLIALWHPRVERLKEVSRKHSVANKIEWKHLLNDPKVQAIILATPPEPRYKLAYEALEAGKHLLLEKPVALSVDEISQMQRLAINKKLSVAVDFEYRAVPLFMQAKKLIEEGLIGQPWLLKLDWLMSSRADPKRPWNWYSDINKGGGVLGALGTHAFDMIHWLLGPTEKINAISSTSILERIDPTNNQLKKVTSEDVALANLQIKYLKDNIIVPAQVALSSVSRQGRGCWLEIYGSKGTLILGSDNQKDYVHGFGLWYATKGEQVKSICADNNFIFNKTWTDGRIAPVNRLQDWWIDSIKDKNPMIPGLSEGLASQKVCSAFKESARSGQTIAI